MIKQINEATGHHDLETDEDIIDHMTQLSAAQKLRWQKMMEQAWQKSAQQNEFMTVEQKLRRDEFNQQLLNEGFDGFSDEFKTKLWVMFNEAVQERLNCDDGSFKSKLVNLLRQYGGWVTEKSHYRMIRISALKPSTRDVIRRTIRAKTKVIINPTMNQNRLDTTNNNNDENETKTLAARTLQHNLSIH